MIDKPKHVLEKFSGDPIKFSNFKRTFVAQVIRYCRDKDEKMAYLEQFTTGEAKNIVSAYSRMSKDGYLWAMEELELH